MDCSRIFERNNLTFLEFFNFLGSFLALLNKYSAFLKLLMAKYHPPSLLRIWQPCIKSLHSALVLIKYATAGVERKDQLLTCHQSKHKQNILSLLFVGGAMMTHTHTNTNTHSHKHTLGKMDGGGREKLFVFESIRKRFDSKGIINKPVYLLLDIFISTSPNKRLKSIFCFK